MIALTPAPGNVDVMVASELLEAGRAMQNGFVSPERTTLVASTHRIYTVAEKMRDGRRPLRHATASSRPPETLAKRAVLFDMPSCDAFGYHHQRGAVRRDGRRGVLPLSRAACEEAIRHAGKGAEGSLKGFALGYAHAGGEAVPASPAEVKAWRANPVERVRSRISRRHAPDPRRRRRADDRLPGRGVRQRFTSTGSSRSPSSTATAAAAPTASSSRTRPAGSSRCGCATKT